MAPNRVHRKLSPQNTVSSQLDSGKLSPKTSIPDPTGPFVPTIENHAPYTNYLTRLRVYWKGKDLRIIAADSSAAVLNEKFEPLTIVASASVLVNPPYREPTACLAKPIFADASEGHEVVIHEAELCRDLLGKVVADVVHLDISLGAIPLEQLSPIEFTNMKISNRAKRHLLKILPRIRRTAGEITQKYGIDVLAIGKESIPVRIAELTSGAHAVLYASEKAVTENKTLLLGLPSKCQFGSAEKMIFLHSLMAGEHDVRGFADDEKDSLKKVNIIETLNPVARGFRILKIEPEIVKH